MMSSSAAVHSLKAPFCHQKAQYAPTEIVLRATRIIAVKPERVANVSIGHSFGVSQSKFKYGVFE